jgi:hypothetical protein
MSLMRSRFLAFGLASVLTSGLLLSSAVGDTSRPPGDWSAAEWASLSPVKRAEEMQAYPSTVGMDPGAKMRWLAQDRNGGPDPSLLAEDAADGRGRSYSTGLWNSGQSPLDRSVYGVRNSWSDLDSSARKLLIVYAGERHDRVNRAGQPLGFLIVNAIPWPNNESGDGSLFTEYDYACGAGPLTIKSGTLRAIAFADAKGHRGLFSLSTRTYATPCKP